MAKRPLAEQVVVITGASSGLGRAVARLAGQRRASVVCAGRNPEALDAAVREVEDAGGHAFSVEFDAASEDECHQLVERTIGAFGEVEQLRGDELRRVTEVNFLGGVYCFSAALPQLKESHGTFIDVNSGLAYRGLPLQA